MNRKDILNIGIAVLAVLLFSSCKNSVNDRNNASEQVITNEKSNDNSGSLSPDRVNMSPPDTTYSGGGRMFRTGNANGSGDGNSAGSFESQ
jgi:protein involved in sex pheromone biosynthesis